MLKKIKKVYPTDVIRGIEALYRNPETGLCYGLMEKAGYSLYKFIVERIQTLESNRIAVICGPGNNGGDGYEAATHLIKNGYQVDCFVIKQPAENTEAGLAFDKYKSAGGKILHDICDFKSGGYDISVDALLGIGLSSDVRENIALWIDAINSSQSFVIGVDIPSGLDSSNGSVCGKAVHCDATITFVRPKTGLIIGSARDYTGDLYFDDLDTQLDEESEAISVLEYEDLKALLPKRLKSGNKTNSGKLLMIGGCRTMPGAIRMAAGAALRTGVGLVKVATCQENLSIVSSDRPELMLVDLNETNKKDIGELKNWCSSFVLGPGLGRSSWSEKIWSSFSKMRCTGVIDADGLYFLAEYGARAEGCVITPHEGEAARLLGISSSELRKDLISVVKKLHERTGSTVVLKGAGTIVYDGKNICVINCGCEGMSVGGMGDVLSGIIGALLAFGLNSGDAARLGTAIHGRAGELEARNGMVGMLPTDLYLHIRKLVSGLQ